MRYNIILNVILASKIKTAPSPPSGGYRFSIDIKKFKTTAINNCFSFFVENS